MKLGLGEANVRLVESHPRAYSCTWGSSHKPNLFIPSAAGELKEDVSHTLNDVEKSNCQAGNGSSTCGNEFLRKPSEDDVNMKRSMSRRNAWGCLSYSDLIALAIKSVPERRLTLSQIYDWMIKNVPYFRDKAESSNSAGWKNSIRHNLSLHRRFMRVQNEGSGKSSWWVINEASSAVRSYRRRAATLDVEPAVERKRSRIRRKSVSSGVSGNQATTSQSYRFFMMNGSPVLADSINAHSASPYLCTGGGDATVAARAAYIQSPCGNIIYDSKMSADHCRHSTEGEYMRVKDERYQPVVCSGRYQVAQSTRGGYGEPPTVSSMPLFQQTTRLPPASVLLSPTSSQQWNELYTSHSIEKHGEAASNSSTILNIYKGNNSKEHIMQTNSNGDGSLNVMKEESLHGLRNELIVGGCNRKPSLLRQVLSENAPVNLYSAMMAGGDSNAYSYNAAYSVAGCTTTVADLECTEFKGVAQLSGSMNEGIHRSTSDCGYLSSGNGSGFVNTFDVCGTNSLPLLTNENGPKHKFAYPATSCNDRSYISSAMTSYKTSCDIGSVTAKYCLDINSYENEVTVITSGCGVMQVDMEDKVLDGFVDDVEYKVVDGFVGCVEDKVVDEFVGCVEHKVVDGFVGCVEHKVVDEFVGCVEEVARTTFASGELGDNCNTSNYGVEPCIHDSSVDRFDNSLIRSRQDCTIAVDEKENYDEAVSSDVAREVSECDGIKIQCHVGASGEVLENVEEMKQSSG